MGSGDSSRIEFAWEQVTASPGGYGDLTKVDVAQVQYETKIVCHDSNTSVCILVNCKRDRCPFQSSTHSPQEVAGPPKMAGKRDEQMLCISSPFP